MRLPGIESDLKLEPLHPLKLKIKMKNKRRRISGIHSHLGVAFAFEGTPLVGFKGKQARRAPRKPALKKKKKRNPNACDRVSRPKDEPQIWPASSGRPFHQASSWMRSWMPSSPGEFGAIRCRGLGTIPCRSPHGARSFNKPTPFWGYDLPQPKRYIWVFFFGFPLPDSSQEEAQLQGTLPLTSEGKKGNLRELWKLRPTFMEGNTRANSRTNSCLGLSLPRGSFATF